MNSEQTRKQAEKQFKHVGRLLSIQGAMIKRSAALAAFPRPLSSAAASDDFAAFPVLPKSA